MTIFLERFSVPGVGVLGIIDRGTNPTQVPSGQRYKLWCEGIGFGFRDSVEEARKAIIHYAYQRLMVEKRDLVTRLEIVNDSLDLILEICPARTTEFQVEQKE